MEQTTSTTLCALLATPKAYYGKRVVVRARIVIGLDSSALSDPQCVDLGNAMLGHYVEKANREKLDEAFHIARIASLSTTKSFRVDVEATFTGNMRGPGTTHSAPMIKLESVENVRLVRGVPLVPPMPRPR
jgi:hypothetical protein